MTPQTLASATEPTYVFPPALVPLVRERLTSRSATLMDVTDPALGQLLTTIFFAGLDTYEGEHNPIGVVFVGRSAVDLVVGEGGAGGALPLYRWKMLRFASPRPFAAGELVKLAVTGANRRIYSAVGVLEDGRLAVTGLAREGFNAGPDPFVKILASRPGCLSIRSGRDLAIEYERGALLAVVDEEVFFPEPVRRVLTAIAYTARVDSDVVSHYLDAVAVLVREIVAHGRGGILIVSADEHPPVVHAAPYRMIPDSSLATLLRLAWRAGRQTEPEHATRAARAREPRLDPCPDASAARAQHRAFGELLHNAFLTEAEQVVEELGRLSAIDGAVVLNRELSVTAFGVILPVGEQIAIVQGSTAEDGGERPVDFSSRGTRHRASATYAAEHPGSVVFVASEDGPLSCLIREPQGPVRLWRLTAIPGAVV